MTPQEIKKLIEHVKNTLSETQNLEIKSAKLGCPTKLYGTLSSFSNQDEGGVILFGLDEASDFEPRGVYDAHDLQKRVNAQCKEMEPVVRPLFSVLAENGRTFVTAEIPALDVSERPCYYKGKGRMKGSWTRVGESDEPMSEYEVYSYEAFRKKYEDDVRPVPRATLTALDKSLLAQYMDTIKLEKPNMSRIPDADIRELMRITREDQVTLWATMLFSPYPQAYFPQLSMVACVVPGTEMGELGEEGERFVDNKRIEGNIPTMLEEALKFVRKNTREKTVIDRATGTRVNRPDYPTTAVREVLLNALVHRDYSIHTEGMPIQLTLYSDRMEVRSPGGLYGRLRVDQLGKVQPDTRNPALATALEVLGVTENRYSGIPTIRREMRQAGQAAPVFQDDRSSFLVQLWQLKATHAFDEKTTALLRYCTQPRTRNALVEFLGIKSASYAIKTYVTPLVNSGHLLLSLPDTPSSPHQRYQTAPMLAAELARENESP